MTRRSRICVAIGALLLAHPLHAQAGQVDVLIRHGRLVDGTGAPERRADVGIRGDRIVFVGDAARAHVTARRTIDATGLVVAPGFIDPHTHTLEDLSAKDGRSNVPYLMQGVTTVVTNNDGGGTTDVAGTLARWTHDGIGTNAALYVPQGAVRRSVMGMSDAAPTATQLDSMRAIVARGMSAGALGLSTGLYYAPGSYATTDEVIALARVAAAQGGIYDSHMRDESSYTIGLVGSINETIRIAREAKIPVHISHIKALGADVWGQSDTVIALIRAARAEGLRVTADQYPYLASGTSVGASLLPRWAEAGGRDSLRARIANPVVRTRLVAEMERNLVRRGGASSLLITSTPDSSIRGRTLAQVAEARRQAPIDAALAIVLAGDAGVASFNMKEADLRRFMVQPWVMTGSDGSDGHPRKYGTFPRKLRQYVFESHVLTLPQAIHASTQLTAATLQLVDRGVVAEGKLADVIVFDPATVGDRATYVSPRELAVGMRYVLVNGRLAVDGGTYTGELAGRALRHAMAGQPASTDDLSSLVEIVRTDHGVPHIRARTLAAAGYGLAWVQIEDYGPRVAMGLLRGRGEMARWFGRDSIEGDFAAKRAYRIALERYPDIDQETREVYEGFAAGANRYIALHPEEFPAGFAPHFTGYDIAARDVSVSSAAQARRVLAKLDPTASRGRRAPDASVDPLEEGSNAWAFAPSRTKSGKAILLRNPHLNWNSGYYEAQMTVPGVLDFYGDFRIGGPFGVIGGFNRDLGWATTNNAPDLEEVYALDVDPRHADHYLLDDSSIPMSREIVQVAFRSDSGLATESRELWRTSLGPVVYRDSARIYVLRAAAEGDYRAGEQFLRMMRARSLEEWKGAMRMRARVTSSFTYADRAGNIFYLWNATAPAFPHASGGDTTAVPVRRTTDVWSHYVPFDSLPQLLNPRGGYIHNENDSPYFTNLHAILDWTKVPAYFPAPSLHLRSQLALALIDTRQRVSLEDVVALKHSYRMLLADRVKDDLVRAVRASSPTPAVASAISMLARWDNTSAPASTGGVLFESWWRRYTDHTNSDTMFAQPWIATAPASTPRGLRDPVRAAQAFAAAVDETVAQYGRVDVPWGDVHRVRLGTVDVPVGGCAGALGCFRVLNFKTDPDGKREAYGGDGWVLAVEFGDQPRAYSILAYGESPREDSPYHSDQAAMFARGEMKHVAFLGRDIERGAVKRYYPGASR